MRAWVKSLLAIFTGNTVDAGIQADLALFKLDELRFSGAADPLAALVLRGADSADHVMVGGQWRVESRELPGIELGVLRNSHRNLARTVQQSLQLKVNSK
jgi:8-oxoguanine deaminase